MGERVDRDPLAPQLAAETACGIYLVSWYPQHAWDPDDWRRDKPVSKLSERRLKTRLAEQAALESSWTGFDIRSFVLNLERRDQRAV